MAKITSGTIARTIVLALALFNQIMAVIGHAPLSITEDQTYQIVSLLCTIGASGVAWWKNNSLTEEAQAADGAMNALKEEAKSEKAIIETDEKLED